MFSYIKSTIFFAKSRLKVSKIKLVLFIAITLLLLLLIYYVSFNKINVSRKSRVSRESRSSRQKRLPSALIIGEEKCGTGALKAMIKLHPKIAIAPKEIHFFDKDENYKKGYEWYRKMMPSSLRGQITIEKSPRYFRTSKVPERVKKMNSHMKLILIVREPVTRAISQYTMDVENEETQYKADQSKVRKSFEEYALFPNGTINQSYNALIRSCYNISLPLWLKLFPREQILILNGDKYIIDPVSQFEKIETFLGLQHKLTSDMFYYNETKGFWCKRKASKIRCLGEKKGRAHPVVNATVIKKLRYYFADYNHKFYEQIGENFNWPEE